jgi:RNA methyltransferase, TrmH family
MTADKTLLGHTSASVDTTLRFIKKLQQARSLREQQKLFYVEGVRNFVQVTDNAFDIETIIYSDKLCTSSLVRKLVRQHKRAGIAVLKVSPEEFRSISTTQRASGVGAIVKQKWTGLESIPLDRPSCWIVLEKIQSEGNLGTLIRTSEAVGGAGFILLGDIEPYAPTVVRVTMGGMFQQQFIRSSLEEFQVWIQQNHLTVLGASPDAALSFHDVDYPNTTFLFLGEERKGLTEEQRTLCSQSLRIPMVSKADSLNLGVAGSLLLYEVLRSRTQKRSRLLS